MAPTWRDQTSHIRMEQDVETYVSTMREDEVAALRRSNKTLLAQVGELEKKVRHLTIERDTARACIVAMTGEITEFMEGLQK